MNLGTDIFLLRIDSILEVAWIKYFGSLEYEELSGDISFDNNNVPVSYTHLRAHETVLDIVCRLLLEKKTI